ncbi:MAG: GGDEF domain-containing protein [Sporolactobacillus sp.]
MIYYVQNTAIGLFILGLILWKLPKNEGRTSQKIYLSALIVNVLLLILELTLHLLNGQEGSGVRLVLLGVVVLIYLLTPVPGALWVLYLESLIKKDNHLPRRLCFIVSLPLLVNGVLTLLNLFVPFSFYLNGNNVYHRAVYFFLLPVICYSFLIDSVVLTLKNRKKILRSEVRDLFIAILPPILAGILQSFLAGISLVWVAMSLSLLMIDVQIQRVQIHTDYLTGLSNKRKFDVHINHLISGDQRRRFGGLLIDLDNFKKLNDTYGHESGDRALEAAGAILRRSVRSEDLVARIGGDEFVIIIEKVSAVILKKTKQRIEENLDHFNKRSDYPFSLKFSIGYALYDHEIMTEANDFIRTIDARMYEVKNRKR